MRCGTGKQGRKRTLGTIIDGRDREHKRNPTETERSDQEDTRQRARPRDKTRTLAEGLWENGMTKDLLLLKVGGVFFFSCADVCLAQVCVGLPLGCPSRCGPGRFAPRMLFSQRFGVARCADVLLTAAQGMCNEVGTP